MKAVTAREMREIDRVTIEEMGLPGAVLMGLAGKAVADHAAAAAPSVGRIAVFAGTGNNGGDGFVAAWFLAARGARVEVFLAGEPAKLSRDARVYHDLCVKGGIDVSVLADERPVPPDLDAYDCIIDALLGTGSGGQPRGPVAAAIRQINDSDAFVVSIDVPSGLGSDGGAPEGEAVIADLTVTIGLPKISLVTYPGRSFAGEVRVADIGFPPALISSDALTTELIDAGFLRSAGIAEIEAGYESQPDMHKGDRGHLLLIGGFDGMEGAILMAARAAFETGIGLATLVTTPRARVAIAGLVPELITLEIPPVQDAGTIREALADMAGERNFRAMVIGPGMGRSPLAAAVFEAGMAFAADAGIRKILVDGDGLYHMSHMKGAIAAPGMLVTPHFMEASRLLGMPVDDIRNDRRRAAGLLAARLSCTAILKGPASIVSDGARHAINTTGGPALAAAGSGDVLAGIIGALLLRRYDPFTAAAVGAYLHGMAADICCESSGSRILKATDLIGHIRAAKACL